MREIKHNNELPTLPNKRYFTIGEVSDLCIVKPHVLRYWEQEFPDLTPVKRRGNRRYYQRHDIMLIRQIRNLLYVEGYTIGGARQFLAGEVVSDENVQQQQMIRQLRSELEDLLRILRDSNEVAEFNDRLTNPTTGLVGHLLAQGSEQPFDTIKNDLEKSLRKLKSRVDVEQNNLGKSLEDKLKDQRNKTLLQCLTFFVGLANFLFPICFFVFSFFEGTLVLSPVLPILMSVGIISLTLSMKWGAIQ